MTGNRSGTRSSRVAALTVVLAAMLLSGGLGVACAASNNNSNAPAGATESANLRQTNDGGNVVVKVTWQGRAAGPVFTVALDTHSVDLDGYDLLRLAALRTDQGAEVQPSSWDAPKGGHHREGKLVFPTAAADGSPLLGPQTHTLELVIRDIAGVRERTFRWTL